MDLTRDGVPHAGITRADQPGLVSARFNSLE